MKSGEMTGYLTGAGAGAVATTGAGAFFVQPVSIAPAVNAIVNHAGFRLDSNMHGFKASGS
jgi:hypothetical protein